MKTQLFQLLLCPQCKQAFSAWDHEQGRTVEASETTQEIKTGLLKCAHDHIYPIVEFIPRIFPGSLAQNSELVTSFTSTVPENWSAAINNNLKLSNPEFARSFSSTQKSFSSEWENLTSSESAWGQDVAERLRLFLTSFVVSKDGLTGKRILDAGCGHGETVLALTNCGAEIFAIDLSSSVDRIRDRLNETSAGNNQVHLVQANLVEIPFKAASFDLVHSAGVLHHTPDTHKSFQAIAPLVRHLGHCFIEVYSNEFKNPVELVIHYAFRIFRVITVRLPLPLLHVLCWLLAIPSWLYIHLFNWISRRSRYVPRNLNQVKLSLFDALSPRYDWHHTTEEVVEWFEKEGFIDMRRTYENLNGIGIVGKKA